MVRDLSNGIAEIAGVLFDRDGYIRRYPDVEMSSLDPLTHFLLVGRHLDRNPGFDFNALLGERRVGAEGSAFKSFGPLEHNPLISILIVSFNSSRDLEVLFQSIAAQTYKNFEVVLIENGHEDTEPQLRRYFPEGIFKRASNIGFAAGNNLAMEASKGELIALINPDTRLERDTLQNLLQALRDDHAAAAAVPLIYFFERFARLRIKADQPFRIQRDKILDCFSYKKLFLVEGSQDEDVFKSTDGAYLELMIPAQIGAQISLSLQSDCSITYCEAKVEFSNPIVFRSCNSETLDICMQLSEENCGNARYIVNNAGSMLNQSGDPYDRGFAELDDPKFRMRTHVDALCGCAALIRRTAIIERKLFFGPSFAYYEDTELSRHFQLQGYRILYEPSARVYHRHSESTEEHSLSWQVLVGRSRKIYEALLQGMEESFSNFDFAYPDEFHGPLRKNLERWDAVMRQEGSYTAQMKPVRRSACVYNSYFNSKGGGEKHALDMASILKNDYDVYLASENDFDINELEDYFNVDLSNVRKLVCRNIDTHFTSKFDLFVNSTFMSQLVPAAKRNLYVVSFPQRHIGREMWSRYTFIHNSQFTARWANSYWGDHSQATVLPILGQNLNVMKLPKDKSILSVGRLTYGGHCKNHHMIINAFNDLVDDGYISNEWSLEIVGSCNLNDKLSLDYYNDIQQISRDRKINVKVNANRVELDVIYARSAIYIHAAGLGVSPDSPELHEHFGISTFEALVNRCVPVVYYIGGPAEQVANVSSGIIFRDFEELKQAIVDAVNAYEKGESNFDDVGNSAVGMISSNNQAFRNLVSR